MKMLWRICRLVLISAAAAVVGVITLVAFTPHDHKVELRVTYHNSPPAAVWRMLTDHASEPQWLPVFGSVERQADSAGRPVWIHRSPDGAFSATALTILEIPQRRYERLLLRDGQPASQSWDGRWVFELEPLGQGSRLLITEYGWTDDFMFFLQQRFFASPHDFLVYYANRVGQALDDPAQVEVIRSH